MKWLAVNDGCCVYMEVTDEQYQRIKEDSLYYLDPEFSHECFYAKGDNAVLACVVGNGSVKDMMTGIKILKKKYKTVSFWNRGHKKFYGGSHVHCQE